MTKNDILDPVKEFSFISSLTVTEPLWVLIKPTNSIYRVSSLNIYHVQLANSSDVEEIVTANYFAQRVNNSLVIKEEIVVTSGIDTSKIELYHGNLLNEENLLNAYTRLKEIESDNSNGK